MPHYIALNAKEHQNASFLKASDYQHAKNDTVAPIVWEELSHVTANIPACFVQTQQSSDTQQASYQLVALQGLQANHNLLIHPTNYKWLFGYVPSHYRGYPFALLKDANSDRQVLCFDTDSGLIKEAPSEDTTPFFEQNGQPTQLIKNTLQFLKLRQTGLQQTQAAVNQLSGHNLLTPWNIQLKNQQGDTTPLKGLYKIDEQKLKDLPADQLKQLAQNGSLAIAYAQLLSEARLQNLQKVHQAQQQMQKDQGQDQEIDLDQVFGEGDDDTFKF